MALFESVSLSMEQSALAEETAAKKPRLREDRSIAYCIAGTLRDLVELLVCSIKDKMNVKNCGDRTGFLCIK